MCESKAPLLGTLIAACLVSGVPLGNLSSGVHGPEGAGTVCLASLRGGLCLAVDLIRQRWCNQSAAASPVWGRQSPGRRRRWPRPARAARSSVAARARGTRAAAAPRTGSPRPRLSRAAGQLVDLQCKQDC